ncbi:MAG: tRNA uridine-5-carboxymethylaminomethyl(34) synthesis GTPase MnmE [Flammeovirgaceae bacterium]|nr:tRNA uridine-5-carboxymethylaminomethyl(34) synthesis GTPase MnmE [Flammeovirgaceae bacterium]
MNIKDTIVAQSTPLGSAATSSVRLSGSESINIVNKVFPSKDLRTVNSHTIHFGNFIYENKIIDEVILSIFKEPNSYTKENIVEISCHGSEIIVNKIILILIKLGARVAERGEFTFRSFINGNMDLSQAESVADLISGKTENAHRIAINHLKGIFSNKIKKLRSDLLNLSSLLELELDFSEEDVEFANRDILSNLLNEIDQFCKILIDSFKLNNAVKKGISVVILGKPNVGKSTLLNNILNDDKAIVSEIPGTTRDIIEDTITIGNNLVRFIDTAGLRKTKDKIENIGIDKALNKIKESSIVLYLIDLHKTSINDIKKEISQKFLKENNLIIVGNKIDLDTKDECKEYFKKNKYMMISSLNENNINDLKDKLDDYIKSNIIDDTSDIMINERHYNSLLKVRESIKNVKINIENKSNTDLLALDIKYALDSLGQITGEVTNDEILGNIFSKFCIGK